MFMNSCPVDYTDLDMVPIGQHQDNDPSVIFPRTPIIDGYMTGISGLPAKFRFRFDIVVEYVPNMDLRAMVEVSSAVANTAGFEKSVNKMNDGAFFNNATKFAGQAAGFVKAGTAIYSAASNAGLMTHSPTGLPMKSAIEHKVNNMANLHITGHGYEQSVTIKEKVLKEDTSVLSDDLKPDFEEITIEKDNCNVSEYVTTTNTKHIRAKK